jgi:hypothetical protein
MQFRLAQIGAPVGLSLAGSNPSFCLLAASVRPKTEFCTHGRFTGCNRSLIALRSSSLRASRIGGEGYGALTATFVIVQ